MAHYSSGHTLGSLCYLPVLFHPFPESVYRCALPSRVWHSRSTSAPAPHATLAVSTRRVLGSDQREPTDIYSGPRLSPRCMVLLSGSFRAEVPSGVSRIAGAGALACSKAEAARCGEDYRDS